VQQSAIQVARYDEPLARNQAGSLTSTERLELHDVCSAAKRLMLRKTHAAALFR
jgi:hypothetical protein